MSQQIEIVVSPTGETRLQTKGFAGQGCRETSKFLEDSLGRQIGEQLTAEFHQAAQHSLQQQQQV
jgi:hypothetical protein